MAACTVETRGHHPAATSPRYVMSRAAPPPLHPICLHRFKQFQGNVSRSNDNKTMSTRRDALREQLEARGESVGEDASTLLVAGASALAFLVSACA